MNATRSVVAAIFMTAIALSLAWARYLPFFQQQDENNHFDYAVTLFSAGRLIPGGEGRTGTETHPYVRLLLDASNGRAVRLDPFARVPAGYGSAAYFERIDAEPAPDALDRYRSAPLEVVPYLTKTYPFLYYALAAVAMTGAAALRPHSAVAVFFAARLFSVACFAAGLVFTWLSLRRLAIPRRYALAVFGCSALLPMATWVGAYVQPDTLAFALIALTVWLTLRAMDGPPSTARVVGPALALGLLAATKRHDALAVAVAVIPAILVRTPGARRQLAAAVVLLVPPAAAFAVTEYFMRAGEGQTVFCRIPVFVQRATPLEFARSAIGSVPHTIYAMFSTGQVFRQFWYQFGAYLSPIEIVDARITAVFVAALELGTLLLVLLTVVRSVRSIRRLRRVAAHRSPRSAARVATANVLVNAYAIYFVILVGVEAYEGDVLALQGRYWYPFVPAVFFVALWLAPRALSRPFARPAAAAAILTVAVFCLAADASAMRAIDRRYYAPGPEIPEREVLVRLDQPPRNAGPRSVEAGEMLRIRGASIDLRRAEPPLQTVFVIDGKIRIAARREPYERVACLNGDAQLAATGIELDVPTAPLAAGRHTIAVEVHVPWSPLPLHPAIGEEFVVRKAGTR
jgi:hypothetical protein